MWCVGLLIGSNFDEYWKNHSRLLRFIRGWYLVLITAMAENPDSYEYDTVKA